MHIYYLTVSQSTPFVYLFTFGILCFRPCVLSFVFVYRSAPFTKETFCKGDYCKLVDNITNAHRRGLARGLCRWQQCLCCCLPLLLVGDGKISIFPKIFKTFIHSWLLMASIRAILLFQWIIPSNRYGTLMRGSLQWLSDYGNWTLYFEMSCLFVLNANDLGRKGEFCW